MWWVKDSQFLNVFKIAQGSNITLLLFHMWLLSTFSSEQLRLWRIAPDIILFPTQWPYLIVSPPHCCRALTRRCQWFHCKLHSSLCSYVPKIWQTMGWTGILKSLHYHTCLFLFGDLNFIGSVILVAGWYISLVVGLNLNDICSSYERIVFVFLKDF